MLMQVIFVIQPKFIGKEHHALIYGSGGGGSPDKRE